MQLNISWKVQLLFKKVEPVHPLPTIECMLHMYLSFYTHNFYFFEFFFCVIILPSNFKIPNSVFSNVFEFQEVSLFLRLLLCNNFCSLPRNLCYFLLEFFLYLSLRLPHRELVLIMLFFSSFTRLSHLCFVCFLSSLFLSVHIQISSPTRRLSTHAGVS